MIKTIVKLTASIFIAQAAGAIGGLVTAPAITTWYPTQRKPPFNPPNWIFGPVWTILYTLMGVALYLVWRRGDEAPEMKPQINRAITIFGIQLGLNTLWSFLFFGLKSPRYALAEIGFLWASILAAIIMFFPISAVAAILLIPYILWVSFASVLNYYIWQLNR
ncbi:MAG TPA: TspO/MBR family protein [Candidatus Aquicultor sp.]|jgi:tryptophan-rich sensory protein